LRQAEIAERLGLAAGAAGQVMVSKDLKVVARRWRASSVRDFDEAKGAPLSPGLDEGRAKGGAS
jgi:hypothetical protein